MIPKIDCLALISLAVFTSSARADVLLRQMYPTAGYSYDPGGYGVSGADVTFHGTPVGYWSTAIKFTLPTDAAVSSFDLALSYQFDTSTHNALIELEGDNPAQGIPNGTILASGVVTTDLFNGNSNTELTSFSPSGGSINLSGGTAYWLVAVPTDHLADLIWCEYSQAATQTAPSMAFSQDGVTYTASSGYNYEWPAFQVVGAVVPEPNSIGLFALSSAGFLGFWRRRRGAQNE